MSLQQLDTVISHRKLLLKLWKMPPTITDWGQAFVIMSLPMPIFFCKVCVGSFSVPLASVLAPSVQQVKGASHCLHARPAGTTPLRLTLRSFSCG